MARSIGKLTGVARRQSVGLGSRVIRCMYAVSLCLRAENCKLYERDRSLQRAGLVAHTRNVTGSFRSVSFANVKSFEFWSLSTAAIECTGTEIRVRTSHEARTLNPRDAALHCHWQQLLNICRKLWHRIYSYLVCTLSSSCVSRQNCESSNSNGTSGVYKDSITRNYRQNDAIAFTRRKVYKCR